MLVGEFHNVFDWTAVGTLALAAVTVVSLVFARSALKKTQAQIELGQAQLAQTQREIELSRREVEEAHRPVLVPFQKSAEGVTFRGGMIPAGGGPFVTDNDPERADLPSYSGVFLPVENVGPGPALNVRGEFTTPRGVGETIFATEAVAAGARGVVTFESMDGGSLAFTGDDVMVRATFRYEDVAGQVYWTKVDFDVKSNAYRSTVFRDGDEDTSEPRRLGE